MLIIFSVVESVQVDFGPPHREKGSGVSILTQRFVSRDWRPLGQLDTACMREKFITDSRSSVVSRHHTSKMGEMEDIAPNASRIHTNGADISWIRLDNKSLHAQLVVILKRYLHVAACILHCAAAVFKIHVFGMHLAWREQLLREQEQQLAGREAEANLLLRQVNSLQQQLEERADRLAAAEGNYLDATASLQQLQQRVALGDEARLLVEEVRQQQQQDAHHLYAEVRRLRRQLSERLVQSTSVSPEGRHGGGGSTEQLKEETAEKEEVQKANASTEAPSGGVGASGEPRKKPLQQHRQRETCAADSHRQRDVTPTATPLLGEVYGGSCCLISAEVGACTAWGCSASCCCSTEEAHQAAVGSLQAALHKCRYAAESRKEHGDFLGADAAAAAAAGSVAVREALHQCPAAGADPEIEGMLLERLRAESMQIRVYAQQRHVVAASSKQAAAGSSSSERQLLSHQGGLTAIDETIEREAYDVLKPALPEEVLLPLLAVQSLAALLRLRQQSVLLANARWLQLLKDTLLLKGSGGVAAAAGMLRHSSAPITLHAARLTDAESGNNIFHLLCHRQVIKRSPSEPNMPQLFGLLGLSALPHEFLYAHNRQGKTPADLLPLFSAAQLQELQKAASTGELQLHGELQQQLAAVSANLRTWRSVVFEYAAKASHLESCVLCLSMTPNYKAAYETAAEACEWLLDFEGALNYLQLMRQNCPEAFSVDHYKKRRLYEAQIQASSFQVLSIEKGAPKAAVNRAFRRMSILWHPDKASALCEDLRLRHENHFKRLNEARIALLDPESYARQLLLPNQPLYRHPELLVASKPAQPASEAPEAAAKQRKDTARPEREAFEAETAQQPSAPPPAVDSRDTTTSNRPTEGAVAGETVAGEAVAGEAAAADKPGNDGRQLKAAASYWEGTDSSRSSSRDDHHSSSEDDHRSSSEDDHNRSTSPNARKPSPTSGESLFEVEDSSSTKLAAEVLVPPDFPERFPDVRPPQQGALLHGGDSAVHAPRQQPTDAYTGKRNPFGDSVGGSTRILDDHLARQHHLQQVLQQRRETGGAKDASSHHQLLFPEEEEEEELPPHPSKTTDPPSKCAFEAASSTLPAGWTPSRAPTGGDRVAYWRRDSREAPLAADETQAERPSRWPVPPQIQTVGAEDGDSDSLCSSNMRADRPQTAPIPSRRLRSTASPGGDGMTACTRRMQPYSGGESGGSSGAWQGRGHSSCRSGKSSSGSDVEESLKPSECRDAWKTPTYSHQQSLDQRHQRLLYHCGVGGQESAHFLKPVDCEDPFSQWGATVPQRSSVPVQVCSSRLSLPRDRVGGGGEAAAATATPTRLYPQYEPPVADMQRKAQKLNFHSPRKMTGKGEDVTSAAAGYAASCVGDMPRGGAAIAGKSFDLTTDNGENYLHAHVLSGGDTALPSHASQHLRTRGSLPPQIEEAFLQHSPSSTQHM
ncbi:putative DnaJ domain-containing protein [Cyclospora cayetanensis]|uniref:DnaJ domain-containing protein n=1 Tax=Cyclospora cayetanensis TaxID=88456 RepID=A0A1D3CVW4_9EIME|nr:putative DnaJ domain-containing protein [Cyclospora cayetanensis]